MFELTIQLSNWVHIILKSKEKITFERFKLRPILLNGKPSDPNIKYKYAVNFGYKVILIYEYINNDIIVCLPPIPDRNIKDEYNIKYLSIRKVYITYRRGSYLLLKKKNENLVEIIY